MSRSDFHGGSATQLAVDVRVSPQPGRDSVSQAGQPELELQLAALRRDYAGLHNAIFEAAEVHRRLCAPHLVRHGVFDIASEIFAVRHLPGDFFTVEETTGGVVFALGDICGKGLAAGMWATHLVGLVRKHTSARPEPRAIVSDVNCDLCRMPETRPLTSLFLARLDPATGSLDYCNAGHPPALLLRADGRPVKLSAGGPLLGAVPAAAYEQGSERLRSGDVMLACSDGILESLDGAGQEFGYERLEAQLCRARTDTASAILFSVLGSVQDFAAARTLVDDMSLVVVRERASDRQL